MDVMQHALLAQVQQRGEGAAAEVAVLRKTRDDGVGGARHGLISSTRAAARTANAIVSSDFE